MATRIYIESTGSTPISPAMGVWTITTGFMRVPGNTTKAGSAFFTRSFVDSNLSDQAIGQVQVITGPWAAQTIAAGSTVKLQIRVAEGGAGSEMFLAMLGRRFNNAGVHQGDWLTGPLGAVLRSTSLEMATSLTNRTLAFTLSSDVTLAAGDYLVFEIGGAGDPIATGHDSDYRIGSASGSDLTLDDETSTTDNNPYIEFSQTLTAYIAPTTVNAVKMAATAAMPTAVIRNRVVVAAVKMAASAASPTAVINNRVAVTGVKMAASATMPTAGIYPAIRFLGLKMTASALSPVADIHPTQVAAGAKMTATAVLSSATVIIGNVFAALKMAASATMATAAVGNRVVASAVVMTASARMPDTVVGKSFPAVKMTAAASMPDASVIYFSILAMAKMTASAAMKTAVIAWSLNMRSMTASARMIPFVIFGRDGIYQRRTRIELYSPAGVKSSTGAIINAIRVDYGQRLDEIGTFSITLPSDDPKVAVLAERWEIRIFVEGEGETFRGIIDDIADDANANGQQTTTITGRSTAARVANLSTLLGREFSGSTPAAAAADLLTSTGFAAGTVDSSANTFQDRQDAISRWQGLRRLANTFGWHVREDVLNSEIDVSALGSLSGIVLANVPSLGARLGPQRTDLFPIRDVKRRRMAGDVVNRIYPVGGGEGINQLTLRWATRSTPYTVQSTTGPDGTTQYYLEDAASVAAYGVTEQWISVKQLIPLANSLAELQAASNALYDVTAAHLARVAQPVYQYSAAVVDLIHVLRSTGAPLWQIGEKFTTRYDGGYRDYAGAMQSTWNVLANLWLMGYRRSRGADGVDAWTLDLASVDRDPSTEATIIGDSLEQVRAIQVAVRPFTYREIHGPERRSIDGTHNVTFTVAYDANVTFLHQALLSVRLKAVRTNATGASSGGGSTSSAGGAQTSSAGGAQTSSAGSSHTHSVSGSTSGGGGSHRHGMFNTDGMGTTIVTADDPPSGGPNVAHAHRVYNGAVDYSDAGVNLAHSAADAHTHTLLDYSYAGFRSQNFSGSIVETTFMLLPTSLGGTNNVQIYTFETATDHTHTVSGSTSGAEAAHTHTVANHTHTVADHTHTISAHTHALSYGIFEGSGPSTPAITVTINGVSRTAALGGPFNADFLDKDVTAYLGDANGQPLRQSNTIVFTSAELLDIEIVLKSIVTMNSLLPV